MRNILFVSNLFPWPSDPQRGLFNASFLAALRSVFLSHGCSLRVLVPVAQSVPGRVNGSSMDASFLGDEWSGHVRYVPYLHLPYIGRNVADLLCGRSLHNHLDWFQAADAVIGSWLYPDAVASGVLARRAGKRFVARLHGSDRFHLDARIRGRRCFACLRMADAVVVNAAFMRDELALRGLDGARVIRNGVDQELFCPGVADEKRSGLVLWVGNLAKIKDPERALRVFGAVYGMGIAKKLVLVGTGPLLRVLRKQVADAGLSAVVEFAGSMDPGLLSGYMRQAHCLLLTSRSEGMPNVVQEALASGTPVVASGVGDVPQVVHSGQNGFCGSADTTTDTQLIHGLHDVLRRDWDASSVSSVSPTRTWDDTAKAFWDLVHEPDPRA